MFCILRFKAFVTRRRGLYSPEPSGFFSMSHHQGPCATPSRICQRLIEGLPASSPGNRRSTRLRVPDLRWQLIVWSNFYEAVRPTSDGKWQLTLPVETGSPPEKEIPHGDMNHPVKDIAFRRVLQPAK